MSELPTINSNTDDTTNGGSFIGSTINRMSMSGKIVPCGTDDDESSVDLEDIQRETDEIEQAPKSLREFFRESQIRRSTATLMVRYDKDRDGDFSKEEVAAIIQDLQNQNKANTDLVLANKILKRLLIGAVFFFFLLTASIFGLTFVVAKMTKDTTVDVASGTLYTKNSEMVVATNARADIFHAESFDFGDCMLTSDVITIKHNVLKGTNVVLQRNPYIGKNVSLEQLTASGVTMDQDVTPTGDVLVDGNGKVCFHLPDSLPGQPPYCITKVGPDHPCNQIGATRRLKERAAARRRLAGGKMVDDVSAPALTSSPLRYGYDRDLQEPAEAPMAYTGSDESTAEDESEGSFGCCR
jgi:hypothetical protein